MRQSWRRPVRPSAPRPGGRARCFPRAAKREPCRPTSGSSCGTRPYPATLCDRPEVQPRQGCRYRLRQPASRSSFAQGSPVQRTGPSIRRRTKVNKRARPRNRSQGAIRPASTRPLRPESQPEQARVSGPSRRQVETKVWQLLLDRQCMQIRLLTRSRGNRREPSGTRVARARPSPIVATSDERGQDHGNENAQEHGTHPSMS